MKLTHYHATHGLAGTIRLAQTGQQLDFHFPKGSDSLLLQVELGGHRFEAALQLTPIKDIDPDEPSNMDLHFSLRSAIPSLQASRQAAQQDEAGEDLIKDGPVEEKRELVRDATDTPENLDVARRSIEDPEDSIPSDPFANEEKVNAPEKPRAEDKAPKAANSGKKPK